MSIRVQLIIISIFVGPCYCAPQQDTTDWVVDVAEFSGEIGTNKNGDVVSLIVRNVNAAHAFKLLDLLRGHLTEIQFENCQLDFDFAKSIKPFDRLNRIRIVDCELSGTVPADVFSSIESFVIDDSQIANFDFRSLQNMNLKFLRIVTSDVSDAQLSSVRNLASLHDIMLRANKNLTNDGIAHLARLPKLQYLIASDMSITGAAFRDFSPDHLLFLDIHNTRLDDDTFQEITKFSNLEVLVINETAITDNIREHLRNFNRIRHLNLSDTNITTAGFERIKSLPNFERHEEPITNSASERRFYLFRETKRGRSQ